MTFQELTRVILSRISFDSKFAESLKLWPLALEHWPVSAERQALTDFLAQIDTNSVKYAQWKLLQSPHFESWREYQSMDPNNPELLKLELQILLPQVRAETPALAVLRNPEKGPEILAAFESGHVVEDELLDLSTAVSRSALNYKDRIFNHEIAVTVPGWPMLSEFIGGFNPGRLALCIAQTGFGKTNLALNLALAAQPKMNCWYFNMEMTIDDIFERLWAIFYGKSFSELRRHGDFNEGQMIQALSNGGKLRMTSGRDKSLKEIQYLARSQSQVEKPGIIFIDYDQKLSLDTNAKLPEWKALQNAMVALEDLAKELSCFVFVLAQANTDGEISGSNRSRFSASSVWSFEDDPELGPVIRFNKNRFGERSKVLSVNYERHCARVTESELIPTAPKKKKEWV